MSTDANIEKMVSPREKIEIKLPQHRSTTGEEFWSGWNTLSNIQEDYLKHTNSGIIILSHPDKIDAVTPFSKFDSHRYRILRDDYLREASKYGHYIKCEINQADLKIFEFINYISGIDFERAAIELTPSSSIKFSLLLNTGESELMLIITRPLHSLEDLDDDSVIFSIFKQDTLLISNAISINSLVEGINSYIAEQITSSKGQI